MSADVKVRAWERVKAGEWQQAKRPKVCRLAANPALCRVVETQRRANWSPEQIAGWPADTRAH